MSQSLAGVTFLAFGNGSPDIFSTFAAMTSNSGGLAIGELFGAACFVTGVVAGSMAIVMPFKVAGKSFLRDVSFFTAAAVFCVAVVADGQLYFWECAAMVAFYAFYVAFVVSLHWYQGRTRLLREVNATMTARSYDEEHLPVEQLPDETVPGVGAENERLSNADGYSIGGASSYSRPVWDPNVDFDGDVDGEEVRARYLSELQKNMRLNHAIAGQRRATAVPIRPSFIGALEFRSSLLDNAEKSQQGEFSHADEPMRLRRYSDEREPIPHQSLLRASTRDRAATAPVFPSNEENTYTPQIDVHPPTPHSPEELRLSAQEGDRLPRARRRPKLTLTTHGLSPDSPIPNRTPSKQTNQYLAPPSPMIINPGYVVPESRPSTGSSSPSPSRSRSRSPSQSQSPSPTRKSPSAKGESQNLSPLPSFPASPRFPSSPRPFGSHGPVRSPLSPFPAFSDGEHSTSSLVLRSPGVPIEQTFSEGIVPPEDNGKFNWWPYRFLPSPYIVLATVFPTLYSWKTKTRLERALGLIAAPSVFFLTVTLPVVEMRDSPLDGSWDGSTRCPSPVASPRPDIAVNDGMPKQYVFSFSSFINQTLTKCITPDLESSGEPRVSFSSPADDLPGAITERYSKEDNFDVEDCNRWLVYLQLLTSPFFIAFIIWLNVGQTDNKSSFLFPFSISLCITTILITALLACTWGHQANRLPRRVRPFLAFLGFAVSIAWIATLAGEVVSILKTIGVIMKISDTVLGLTVFAFGNSVGDFVANITIAKLGYPLMALGACFGGPMLNILIGIGVSGMYMSLHPSKKYNQRAPGTAGPSWAPSPLVFNIDVSATLLISGGTLLLILVGFLIFVPLNHWKLDRKAGWTALSIWFTGTLASVIVDITNY